jgi:hypothetical protein
MPLHQLYANLSVTASLQRGHASPHVNTPHRMAVRCRQLYQGHEQVVLEQAKLKLLKLVPAEASDINSSRLGKSGSLKLTLILPLTQLGSTAKTTPVRLQLLTRLTHACPRTQGTDQTRSSLIKRRTRLLFTTLTPHSVDRPYTAQHGHAAIPVTLNYSMA